MSQLDLLDFWSCLKFLQLNWSLMLFPYYSFEACFVAMSLLLNSLQLTICTVWVKFKNWLFIRNKAKFKDSVVAQSTSTVGTLVWFDPFNICGEYSYPVLSHYFFLGRILSIYEGVKFPCNICDYKATHKERVLTRVVTTKKLQPKFSFVSIFNPLIIF